MSQPENNTVVMTKADFNRLVALIPEAIKQAHRDLDMVPKIHVVNTPISDVIETLGTEVN